MSEAPDSVEALGSGLSGDAVHPDARQARALVEKADLSIDADSFERRVDGLIRDAGFSPKRARFRALDEMTSLTREQMGEVFGSSKGTMDATASDVRKDVRERTVGHYAMLDHPMNFLAQVEFRAESPADYIERIFFYEFSYADPTPRKPGPKPPRPRYCVIVEALGPYATGYAVSDISIERYLNAEGVIEDLYEEEYFWSVTRAAEWRDLLEFVFDTDIETPPDERLNPDFE